MLNLNSSGLCVVFGVNGQDGSYLADTLVEQNRHVIGVGRQSSSRYLQISELFGYRQLDIADTQQVILFLNEVAPTTIFHAAAIHGASGFKYEDKWLEAHSVNTLSVHAVLEYLRLVGSGNLVYFSSSKAFANDGSGEFSEKTKRESKCIYSITKNSASDLIRYYRIAHNVCGSTLWTFNHESPRRGPEYFIPKIVSCLSNVIYDPSYQAKVFSLNFCADWSDAQELMRIAVKVSDSKLNEDFVLASGHTTLARSLVRDLFLSFGFDYKNHIIETDVVNEFPKEWTANVTKLEAMLGCRANVLIFETCLNILYENHGHSAENFS